MSIADAYVELHVDGDNLDGEVRTAVKKAGAGADKESDDSGSRLGSRLAAGFLKGWKDKAPKFKSDIKKSFDGMFKGLNFKGLLMPAIGAIVPFITSALSALSGAVVAFTGAVAQASTAALSFGGVLGGLIQGALVAKMAFKDFGKAVGGDEEALAALTPAAREAAKAAKELGDKWGNLRKSVQQQVFKGLDGVFERIGNKTLPVLGGAFRRTGTQVNLLIKDVGRFITSSNGLNKIKTAVNGNAAIFGTLRKAAVPALKGILNLYNALLPSSKRLSGGIVGVAQSFRKWSSAEGFGERMNAMMKRAWTGAKNLWGIFRNLGGILRNVFGAATPAGQGLLKTLNGLTERLLAFTELASTKNAIAGWAEKGIEVSGRLFTGLGKIGEALLPLFNPSIAGGYLDVFEKMMPTITGIVTVVQSALTPVLKGIGDAFAENGPKFKALFSAVAPLLKGVGSVVGELIKQVIGTLGTVAVVLTPVIATISNFLGPILSRFAPIIATVIFAFTNWSSVIIKMIPVVGKFLYPLAKLAELIWKAVGPALKVLGKIFGAVFKGMLKVGGFVLKALGMWVKVHFTIIRVIITTVMKGVWAVVKFVWRGISVVIRGAVKIISTVVRTYFNIVRTVITTVMKGIWAVIRGVWKAITFVVGGAVRGIVAVVKGAWNLVRSVTSAAWNGLRSMTAGLWAKMVSAFSNGIDNVVGFVRSLPGKILSLAASWAAAGRDLGGKVIDGILDGLRSAGGFVSDLMSSIKSAINGALNLPFTIKGPGPLPDFTIPAFATGTISAPGGIARVGERGPENVYLPRGSKVDTAARTRAGDRNPGRPGRQRKVILRIGSRDFEAYVEEIADGRIDASDSLAFQGA